MVYDLLTDSEKDTILNYLYYFGEINPRVDLKDILSPWDLNKSGFLDKVFKNQLIYEKDIEFYESYDEIEDKINNIYCEDDRFRDFFRNIYSISVEKPEDQYIINAIVRFNVLAENKIGDSCLSYGMSFPYTLELPKGKKIKIDKGCKPMKIIRKVAEAYDIPDFDYFCIKCSQALNTKKIKGKLCLSIHPMDYITMSDNECGWDSCMNWRDNGDYRQGTVEMMNSPCVVVAYLKSSEPLIINRNESISWNSKKWRCLFIVNENFVVSDREYPYNNENLVKVALQEMGKLMNFNTPIIRSFRNGATVCSDRGYTIELSLDATGAMYNDFDCGYDHFILINSDLANNISTIINFCGPSECMCCGETYNYWSYTSELVCSDCDNRVYCECCDNRVSIDYARLIDDIWVCESCIDYSDNIFFDDVTGEYHFIQNYSITDLVIVEKDEDANTNVVVNYTTCFGFLQDYGLWKDYFIVNYKELKYDEDNDRYIATLDQLTDSFAKKNKILIKAEKERGKKILF